MTKKNLKIRNARTDIVQHIQQKSQHEAEKAEKTQKLNELFQNVNISEAARKVLRDEAFSDFGNAERFLAVFREKYININEQWYQWNDKFWQKVDEKQLYKDFVKVLRIARGMYELSESESETEAGKTAIRSLINSENEYKLRSALHIASAEQNVDTDTINKNPWLFNAANCTINLQLANESTYKQKRTDYITQIARAEYNQNANTETWEKFVSEVFQDEDVRHYVQKFLGYCLTGLTSEHKLLILVGDGRNGKSTFINAISYALGTYANAIDPELLLRTRADFADKPTPALASLQSKRLTIASETRRGRALNDALIKNITSDDQITARKLNQNPITFSPTHKLVLMTNYVPEITNVDDPALKSRIIIVPCDAHFKHLDRTLPERLKQKENMSAILNWLIEGCENYQDEGLDELPAAIKNILSDYYEKNDELGQFITERCVVDENEHVKLTDFVKELNCWRELNGYKKVKSKTVREALERRGFQYKIVCDKSTERHSIRAIIGLAIFSEGSEAEDEKVKTL